MEIPDNAAHFRDDGAGLKESHFRGDVAGLIGSHLRGDGAGLKRSHPRAGGDLLPMNTGYFCQAWAQKLLSFGIVTTLFHHRQKRS